MICKNYLKKLKLSLKYKNKLDCQNKENIIIYNSKQESIYNLTKSIDSKSYIKEK